MTIRRGADGVGAAGEIYKRGPRIPAIGPVLRGKFLVAFEIGVALHLADRKNETELRAVLTAVIS